MKKVAVFLADGFEEVDALGGDSNALKQGMLYNMVNESIF